jgi:lysophospholipase L1-like esterase
MASDPRKRQAIERGIGAVLLALPLLYLLTERSREVWLWRWSATWCVAIAGYALGYGVYLLSYRRAWPAPLRVARTLLVVVLASTLAALLGCEIVLRALRGPPPEQFDNRGRHTFDPDVGHVYVPNFEQLLQSSEFSAHWKSNAQGLRADRDYGPKPAGIVRVLALGDSFTVGDQVELPQTWPAVLEACLRSRVGERVEVLNAGFPGFGTIHERNWLRKFGAAFEPDLVLLAVTPNDILENQFPLLYVGREGALVGGQSENVNRDRWRDRQRWFSLPGWVARTALMQRLRGSSRLRKLTSGHSSPHWRAFAVQQDKKAQQLQDQLQELLASLRETAQSMGARFAILAVPFREELPPPEEGADPRLFGGRLKTWGDSRQVPVLDLLPAFRDSRLGAALYWKEDAHCTAEGYRLIGETSCRFLLEHAAELALPESH